MTALTRSALWLIPGLLVGLAVGAWSVRTPVLAVGNDRSENFAIATGPLDDTTEAIVALDPITGTLRAAAISPTTGVVTNVYERTTLAADMELEAGTTPKFLMVTGMNPLRARGGAQFGGSFIYVAETTSGKVAAYAMPFNRAQLNSSKTTQAQLELVAVIPFRTAAIRN